jgi:hypothetical protein
VDSALDDRRESARFTFPLLEHLRMTMTPGNVVELKNLGAGGALVHSKRALLPGTRVHVQIAGGTHRLRLGGEVLRCGVAALGADGVTYLGAVRFDSLCDLPWRDWLRVR